MSLLLSYLNFTLIDNAVNFTSQWSPRSWAAQPITGGVTSRWQSSDLMLQGAGSGRDWTRSTKWLQNFRSTVQFPENTHTHTHREEREVCAEAEEVRTTPWSWQVRTRRARLSRWSARQEWGKCACRSSCLLRKMKSRCCAPLDCVRLTSAAEGDEFNFCLCVEYLHEYPWKRPSLCLLTLHNCHNLTVLHFVHGLK